jgi:hypothetical protein
MIKRLSNSIKAQIKAVLVSLFRWNDFRKYSGRLTSFRRLLENLPAPDRGSFLIISGRGMNVSWAQMWTVLSLAVRVHGYKGYVLTTRGQRHLNRYFRLLDLELIFYDDNHFLRVFPGSWAKKWNGL